MKQITENAVIAFDNSYDFKSGNTRVTATENETKLYLFNNLIARKCRKTYEVKISSCGYTTATTRERLNGLLSRYMNNFGRVYIKDFTFYYENSTGTKLILDNSYITIT